MPPPCPLHSTQYGIPGEVIARGLRGGVFSWSYYGTSDGIEANTRDSYTEHVMRIQWGKTADTMISWMVARRSVASHFNVNAATAGRKQDISGVVDAVFGAGRRLPPNFRMNSASLPPTDTGNSTHWTWISVMPTPTEESLSQGFLRRYSVPRIVFSNNA